MRQQSIENRINELFAQLVTEVRGATALGLTDINKLSEDCLVPVLKRSLDLPGLRNLNQTEQRNFPAIDLADDTSETAIQITATPDRSKIMDTLTGFMAHGLYTSYRRLLIFVITEKKERYSDTGISEALGGRLDFNINRDVIDYRDILRALHSKPLHILDAISRVLEGQLSKTPEWAFQDIVSLEPKEIGYLNLLDISFPQTLYVADIAFDEERRRPRRRSGSQANLRDRVWKLMEERHIRFSSDWTCHEKQIITFHDLSDPLLPISEIVDRGTLTTLAPDEYYGEGEDQERVFKSLLHYCLKQALYKKGIQWQHLAEVFIFCPLDEEQSKRQEAWGSERIIRTVYEKKMTKRDPTRVMYHKHLAFGRQFLRLESAWFLVLKPEWFFSYDGYNKSRYCDEKVTWLKKHEWNKNVYTHLRFLVDFLTTVPNEDLFDGQAAEPYPFLKFGKLVSFSDLPMLPDSKWLIVETTERQKRIDSSQKELEF